VILKTPPLIEKNRLYNIEEIKQIAGEYSIGHNSLLVIIDDIEYTFCAIDGGCHPRSRMWIVHSWQSLIA